MASWTEMFTYGTEIAYDFTSIMLKYYKNLDLDGSGSLNKDEFRISYAKMALLAAHVEMDILDANGDGILQGNELKTFTTLTVRGANVCLPGYFLSLSTFDSPPVLSTTEFQLDTSSISAILDSISGYIWNNFLCPGPESSSGTGQISGHIFQFLVQVPKTFSTLLPKCTLNLVSPMSPMSIIFPSTTQESWLPSSPNMKTLNYENFTSSKIMKFLKFFQNYNPLLHTIFSNENLKKNRLP